MEGILYLSGLMLNYQIGKDCYKRLSKAEKIGIGATIALGIDAIITPALTGKTLHEMILETGFKPDTQLLITAAEGLTACAGQIYHAARTFQICAKDKVIPSN